jgi:hypothetical protein
LHNARPFTKWIDRNGASRRRFFVRLSEFFTIESFSGVAGTASAKWCIVWSIKFEIEPRAGLIGSEQPEVLTWNRWK